MARNQRTHSLPVPSHPSLNPHPHRVDGPLSFLNPTVAHYQHVDPAEAGEGQAASVAYKWTSRSNRKGRHILAIPSNLRPDQSLQTPESTSQPRAILNGLVRMVVKYPVYDISWDIAYLFVWGSIVWVFNAFFVYLPLVKPSTTFANETTTAAGVTAFVGATIFEIGSVLLMIEAVNENRTGCFGWALQQVMEEFEHKSHSATEKAVEGYRLKPDLTSCEHHHANSRNFVGKARAAVKVKQSSDGSPSPPSSKAQGNTLQERGADRTWVWCPTWYELKTHYFHELGFLACFFQLIGATIFWISGFTALPGILNHLSPGLENGIYWSPQVIGGTGFIISGILFTVEAQKKWYIPALNVLGWHIGFWNFIGGLGFTLSPAFGYSLASWAQYQAALSTFWGSWAFLIGSTFQWYESLDKHPVHVEKT